MTHSFFITGSTEKLTEENKQEKYKLLHDPNIAHEDNSKNDHQGN